MSIRNLFIITLLTFFAGCSGSSTRNTELHNLTVFELEQAPQIKLIRDDGYKGARSEVRKIGDIAVDDEGNVYLVDEYRRKIQVYDEHGSHTGSIGRAGPNPGEFQKPGTITVTGNSLYAWDEDKLEMMQFDLGEYELLGTTRFSDIHFSEVDSLKDAAVFNVAVTAEGDYLASFQVVRAPDDRRLFYYRINAAGEVTSDQLMSFQNKSLYVEEGGKGSVIMMLPYERETLIETDSENKIYTLFTEDILIKVLNAEGNYQKAWHYPFRNKKMVESDAVAMFTNVDIRRAIRGADKPSSWPAVDRLMIDDMDRLWVATISGNLDTHQWYVLKNTGEILGTFSFPKKKEIKEIKNGEVYTREFNNRSYSEEVVRYKITFNKKIGE
jgi:hypothetical protein